MKWIEKQRQDTSQDANSPVGTAFPGNGEFCGSIAQTPGSAVNNSVNDIDLCEPPKIQLTDRLATRDKKCLDAFTVAAPSGAPF